MAVPSTRFHPLGFKKQKAAALMRQHDLSGILLTSPENVFYTTGYTALPSSGNPILYTLRNRLPFFSYVDGDGQTTLLCWGFSAQGVDFGADALVGFNDYAGALEAVRTLLRQQLAGGGRLGVESTCPYYVLQLIEETMPSRAALFVADGLLARLRLIKSAEEIALLRKSTEIIEQTVGELYGILHRGMSRLDLTREAKYRMIRNGATGISHITFSFAQANPEVAIGETLDEGRLATLDLGGIYDGYCSDNRRYAYAGQIPQSLLDRYRAMVEIVDMVGAALVPGTTYAWLFRLAQDLYARHGISALARFNHVGHNIGLETEEQWLDDDPQSSVEEGMVINIELYSMAETGEQIGDEETYIIGPAGPERISVLPREIRSV
jgi:Xaa-Pro aminopeptidase